MDDEMRDAEVVAWESPGGVLMVLAAGPEGGGSTLRVGVDQGVVHVSGRNCQYRIHDIEGELTGKKGIAEKTLSEIEITVPLSRCQITWKHVEQPTK